jgi:hypothetical protein
LSFPPFVIRSKRKKTEPTIERIIPTGTFDGAKAVFDTM